MLRWQGHDPTDHRAIYLHACFEFYVGDLAAYETDCKAMLDRFSKTDSPRIRERTVKALMLATADGATVDAAIKLVDKNLASGDADAVWDGLAKGMSEYRKGNYDSAIQFLDRCYDASREQDFRITADFYRSMALFRSGQKDAAAAAFDRGLRQMHVSYRAVPTSELAVENWLILHIAHREAAQLLNHPSAHEEPATRP